MNDLWTIIFIAAVVAAFAVAALHDRDKKKSRARREAALEERGRVAAGLHADRATADGDEGAAAEELGASEDERQAAHTRG